LDQVGGKTISTYFVKKLDDFAALHINHYIKNTS